VTRSLIRAWLAERFPDEAFLLADGFEDAFVGVVTGKGREPVVCYDRERCIGVLIARDGMSREEAEEFFGFNVEDAWVGERTPVFLERAEP
jgi:hypothetical protein